MAQAIPGRDGPPTGPVEAASCGTATTETRCIDDRRRPIAMKRSPLVAGVGHRVLAVPGACGAWSSARARRRRDRVRPRDRASAGSWRSTATSRARRGCTRSGPGSRSIAIDRRLRVFDPPAREVITGDKRNLEVAPLRRLAGGRPVRFLRSAGTLEPAEARLNERVSAALSDAIGRRDLAALASTDPRRWRLDALTGEVLAAVAPAASDELGVEVVDVRLRRFNHPVEVRPAVFDLIRSERRQVAATPPGRGRGPVPDAHQPGRPRARRDPRPGRRRGRADPRPGRGRGDPAPERGPRPRPEVLRVPPHARSRTARSSTTGRRSSSRRRARC